VANELQALNQPYLSGLDVDFYIRNVSGQIWNTSSESFETYNVSNLDDYAVQATEDGESGVYLADLPNNLPKTTDLTPYSVTAKERTGASPAEDDRLVATGSLRNETKAIFVMISGVRFVARPVSETRTVRFFLNLYDAKGKQTSPDTAPSVSASSPTAGRSGNLGSVVHIVTGGAGQYVVDYSVAAGHAEEEVTIEWSVTTDGEVHRHRYTFYVHDAFLPATDEVQANVTKVFFSSTAAIRLEDFWSAVETGSIDSGSPSTTVFNTNRTEADDHWNDSVLVFVNGDNQGVARRISDYQTTDGQITLEEPLPETPSIGDDFLIIGVIET